MIHIRTDTDQYFKIRFKYNDLTSYGNHEPYVISCSEDPSVKISNFKDWLKAQGARFEPEELPDPGPNSSWVCDSVGVVVSKEHIVFDNDIDYTMFVLRWS